MEYFINSKYPLKIVVVLFKIMPHATIDSINNIKICLDNANVLVEQILFLTKIEL